MAVEDSPAGKILVRAQLLAERIDTKALHLPDHKQLMQTPRIFAGPSDTRVAVFRFGAVVTASHGGAASADVPVRLRDHLIDPFDKVETETVEVVLGDPSSPARSDDDQILMADFSAERFSILANVLAKSVALSRDEQRIHAVFEKLEPFARELARAGGRTLRPAASLKMLGDALLAQHRMVSRVEVHDKPDVLWDRPDLIRLYTILDETYELSDRARELSRKLKVIEETTRAIAEVADSYISRRLEIAIVALIVVEVLFSLYGFWTGRH